MIAALENALSGMNAASRRVDAVASNVANVESTATLDPIQQVAPVPPAGGNASSYQGYQPVQVEQESVAGGGTKAVTKPVDPPSVPVYDPSNPDANPDGIVQMPNVSLESQMVELLRAKVAYEASAKVVKAVDDMTGVLVNSKT